MRSCNKVSISENELNDSLRIDTVYKQGNRDTVRFDSIVYLIKWKTPDTIIDTEIVHDSINGSDTLRTYATSFSDSLINGTITCKVKGVLLNTKLDYKPLFPKYITQVDTIKITKPTPVYKQKWGLYAGGIIGGSLDRFSLQPALLIKTNKDLQFSLGYELIGKTYNVGVFTKIKNPFK
jgi:hypothetical protein